ncbi:excalibur calcium-binding domain-containing protein [Kineosporia succinea]|uniref:Excalibur calcium-binding domain-containing protein n=1 Tax=Kineosporia succinea TaxID=84632 RepID=A0ABT9P601_9ACTN|nr:excalibur calcium-binding domain-containing protein [Kineosporia succinea]MDP9827897.1 hypothetical protein [Kineosporia succinea]
MTLGLAVAGLAGVPSATAASSAPAQLVAAQSYEAAAAKKPKVYKNCTALHKDYQHGIRKKGGKDVVKGKSKPVPSSLIPIRTALYKVNTKLDRDKDGVACEAR